jgi:hypothetical protein
VEKIKTEPGSKALGRQIMAFLVSKTAILGLKTAIFGTLIKYFKLIA